MAFTQPLLLCSGIRGSYLCYIIEFTAIAFMAEPHSWQLLSYPVDDHCSDWLYLQTLFRMGGKKEFTKTWSLLLKQ